MKDEKYLMKIMDNISENEIIKVRENYNDDKKFNNYLYKTLEKIFTKIFFPYMRFEILLACVKDRKENNKYYPNMNKEQLEKINIIFDKLQKICVHLNLASEEFLKMLTYIEKP